MCFVDIRLDVFDSMFHIRTRCLILDTCNFSSDGEVMCKTKNSGLSIAIPKRDKLMLISFLNPHLKESVFIKKMKNINQDPLSNTTTCTKIRACETAQTYP